MKNKGYVLTMDAVIALIFVIGVFIAVLTLDFFNPNETSTTAFLNLHYVAEDSMDVLNKVGVLDDIGELWSLNDNLSLENASNITKENLELIIPPNVGYTLAIEGDIIYNSDDEINGTRPRRSESSVLTTSRRLLVGYGKDKPIRGCVARTYLTEIKSKTDSVFIYFGGFEGEGDLTKYVKLPEGNVEGIYIEVDAGNDFNLGVNGHVIESYDVDPAADVMGANVMDTITNPDDLLHFDMDDDNLISITFTEAENKYIGGGYIRVDYNTSEMVTFQ